MTLQKRIVMIWALGTTLCMQAGVTTIASRDHFNRTLQEYDLAVAYFYELSSDLSDELRGNITAQDNVFEATSREMQYVAANIAFMRVDVGIPELADLKKLYALEELPTFIVFKGGTLVTESPANKQSAPRAPEATTVGSAQYELDITGDVVAYGMLNALAYEIDALQTDKPAVVQPNPFKPERPVVPSVPSAAGVAAQQPAERTLTDRAAYSPRKGVLVGFVTQQELERFIDTYFADDIDAILRRREQAQRAVDVERPRVTYYRTYDYAPAYWGWGGWGYPYSYGYGPYYGGYYGGYYGRPYGGIGFGFGWGGGRGRGYYRRHR